MATFCFSEVFVFGLLILDLGLMLCFWMFCFCSCWDLDF